MILKKHEKFHVHLPESTKNNSCAGTCIVDVVLKPKTIFSRIAEDRQFSFNKKNFSNANILKNTRSAESGTPDLRVQKRPLYL